MCSLLTALTISIYITQMNSDEEEEPQPPSIYVPPLTGCCAGPFCRAPAGTMVEGSSHF
jgi:hypothetical protein